jgi:hypothetical protein
MCDRQECDLVARSYGKVYLRIWADQDWCALDMEAQHLYLLLLSQPSINLAGVIPVQVRRWASRVADWKPEQVENALGRLAEGGFVVVDLDTEECLVRSLIRNDEYYRAPGALKSILETAEATQSAELRQALADELGRLPALEGKTAEAGAALIAATRRVLVGGGDPPPIGGQDAPMGTTPSTTPDGTSDGTPGTTPDGTLGTTHTPIYETLPGTTPGTTPGPTPGPTVIVSGTSRSSLTSRTSSVSDTAPAGAGQKTSSRRKPKRPVPDDFAVTPPMREWHRGRGISDRDADRQTERFIGHAKANDRVLPAYAGVIPLRQWP